MEFSRKILEKYCIRETPEVNSEKAMLQAYYCREILDWITSKALGKYIKGDNADEQLVVWNLLGTLLQTTQWTISPTVILSLAAAIEDLSKVDMPTVDGDLLEDLCNVITIFCEGGDRVVLHLEHAASLLEACLHMYTKYRSTGIVLKLALLSSKLFTLHMDRFALEKKVWDSIVVRQFDAVCFGAFYEGEDDSADTKQMRMSMQTSCQMILHHAILSHDTLCDLADSLSASKEDSDNARQSYTNKLVPILNTLAVSATQHDCQVVEATFSWLLRSFSATLAESRDSISEKFRDADSILFFRLVKMILGILEDSLLFKMRLLASLTKEIKASGLYRPTGLGGSERTSSLLEITSSLFDHGMESDTPEIASACLQALDGILVVEHRGIEERLVDYWSLIRQSVFENTQKSVERSVALLMSEFCKLRRLDKVFLSLGDILNHPDTHFWRFLFASPLIMSSMKYALRNIPSGQSTRFIDSLINWTREMDPSAAVYAASASSLILGNIPVDLNNATKVFSSASNVLESIQMMIKVHLTDSGCDVLSSLLVIHADLHRICMECSKIDPNIAPLHLQGVRPPYWKDIDLNAEFTGSIEMFATSGTSTSISLPMLRLAERARSLDGQERARLVYSLTLTIKTYLSVRTEQFQYKIHRVTEELCCDNDVHVAGLMNIFYDLIKLGADTYDGTEKGTEMFHNLSANNLTASINQFLKDDFEWLEDSIGCLLKTHQLKQVKLLLSVGFLPSPSFCVAHIDSIINVSYNMMDIIQNRLQRLASKSGKKRKADGSEQKVYLLQMPGLLAECPINHKEFQKAMDRTLKDIGGTQRSDMMKTLLEKYQDDVAKSFELACVLCKLCFTSISASQSVRGICLVHIYYAVLILSYGLDVNGNMEKHCTAMIDGFCHQTKLLHAHASLAGRSESARTHQVLGLYKLAEILLGEKHLLLDHLQHVVSGEVDLMVCDANDVLAITSTVRKDTSLAITRSICKLAQDDEQSMQIIHGHYDDIFYQLAKQIKHVLRDENHSATYGNAVSSIACTLSEALPILAMNNDSKLRSKVLDKMPRIFTACIKELIAEFSSDQLRMNHVCNLCGFVETYTRLSSSMKPRISWEEYVNLFSALLTVLYVCPQGIGRGHKSRPNAPKEAMVVSASSVDVEGKSHRAVLRALMELISGSTRDECTRLVHLVSLRCTPILEILLIMLEDTENGVLKDLLDNQVDVIAFQILQFLQDSPSRRNRKEKDRPSPREFLHSIRSTLLLPAREVPRAEWESGDYFVDITIAYRCIESIVCRPSRFKKFPRRWIPMLLSTVESISSAICHLKGNHNEECFIGMSNILVGLMRHQPVSRILHLLSLAIRSMQNSLFIMLHVSQASTPVHVIESFCRVLEEFSNIRAVQPYCKDVILTHVKLFMSPVTQRAIEDSLPQPLHATSIPSLSRMETKELIAPGICALYGACSADDIQDIYASLGRQVTWQSALNDLKLIYESQFRYIGKV